MSYCDAKDVKMKQKQTLMVAKKLKQFPIELKLIQP